MRVKAIATGFHKGLRRAGDEFEVPAGLKGKWFVPVKVADPHPLDHDADGKKGGSKAKAKAEAKADEPLA